MSFLFLLALGVLALSLVNMKQGEAASKPNKADWDCTNTPPGKAARHKWILKFPDGSSDHMGYLICKTCRKSPGEL